MMAEDDPRSERPAPKTFVEHAKGLAALPGEKLAELKAFGEEKIDQSMAGFRRALPALRQAGYQMREFEIELGITPKIIAHFIPFDVSEEDVAAAREALKDNPVGVSMLSVLKRAGDAHKRFKVMGFSCAEMELDIGVIPAARLRYRAEDA
ncbi:hypothetical protein [Terricaulis sp.]|uniref:hypothetical protein n=1 Tax=Terricaulis sp. TaxID=2768686 RepID=UPI003783E6A8